MSLPHARPGEVVNVQPLGSALADTRTQTLMRGQELEVIKMILPPGKEIQEHKAKGEIVVQCLEGRILFTASGKTTSLQAGDCLYLPTGEPHSVKAPEYASVLLTVVLPRRGREAEWVGDSPESGGVEREEVVRQRGILLSAMQAIVLVTGLVLLFAVVANSILVGVACVAAVVAVLACLHYWTWGRQASRTLVEEEQRARPAGPGRLRLPSKPLTVNGAHRIGG